MKCILWDPMVTCTLFLFVLYLLFCCLFLIYNFAFLKEVKTGLYAIILLGRAEECFTASVIEETFTT